MVRDREHITNNIRSLTGESHTSSREFLARAQESLSRLLIMLKAEAPYAETGNTPNSAAATPITAQVATAQGQVNRWWSPNSTPARLTSR